MKGLLKNIVGAVAPTLGTAISGPLGGMAMGKIAEVLGVSNDVFKLEVADKQNARGMFSKDWTARIIGLFTIGGFLGYIFLVTLQPPEQNSEALINLVLGYLGGLASAIISFYFGASHTNDKGE